ncbi:MAG: hypothetical protein V7603_3082 [Micromonosporaceae bacterium]
MVAVNSWDASRTLRGRRLAPRPVTSPTTRALPAPRSVIGGPGSTPGRASASRRSSTRLPPRSSGASARWPPARPPRAPASPAERRAAIPAEPPSRCLLAFQARVSLVAQGSGQVLNLARSCRLVGAGGWSTQPSRAGRRVVRALPFGHQRRFGHGGHAANNPIRRRGRGQGLDQAGARAGCRPVATTAGLSWDPPRPPQPPRSPLGPVLHVTHHEPPFRSGRGARRRRGLYPPLGQDPGGDCACASGRLPVFLRRRARVKRRDDPHEDVDHRTRLSATGGRGQFGRPATASFSW